MRFYQQKSTVGELRAIIKYAKKTCNAEMKNALSDALDPAVDAAKAVTPVYNPAKWVGFWNYSHHYIPPGTLKESIRHTKPVCHGRGLSYSVQFRADAPFASYIEGGFEHKMAKKLIVGKHMMESSYDLVFIPTWQLKMRENVKKMFLTKAT